MSVKQAAATSVIARNRQTNKQVYYMYELKESNRIHSDRNHDCRRHHRFAGGHSHPSFRNAIETARQRTCGINRKNIDGAKVLWAADKKQPLTATPTDDDLFGKTAHIPHKPDCPAGGAYALNTVEHKCTCNAPVHADYVYSFDSTQQSRNR